MTLWYLARAAGLSALIALSFATALGALVSGQPTATGRSREGALGRRVIVQYLHRAAAVLGVSLLVLHIGALVLDSKSGVSAASVAIPFTSAYRPLAVGLGTVAAYLLVLIAVTGAARGRLTSSPTAVRIWRGIHLSSYALWAIAVGHGFLAGSDSGLFWVRVLDVALIAMVGGALALRLRSRSAQLRSPLSIRRAMPALVPVPVRVPVGAPSRGARR